VIGGDAIAGYWVIHDGRAVGRIRLATEQSGSRAAVWYWMINVPLSVRHGQPFAPRGTGS
jgi:hypothetical protein